MNRSWIVRKLGEALQAAQEVPCEGRHGQGREDGRIAMLIDTENVAPALIDEIMSRAGSYGEIVHRSAFGAPTEGRWKAARRRHGIVRGRQSLVNSGKNCADMELTIAAMELLRDRSITGFCIASSDSDFTPIVMRLREAGKLVVGFGEKKAATGFVEACDRFEVVGEAKGATPTSEADRGTGSTAKDQPGNTGAKQKPSTAPQREPSGDDKARKEFLELVMGAASGANTRDGWVLTSVLGTRIRKLEAGIRYQNYGHRTLIGILNTYPNEIETKKENGADLMRVKEP